MTKIELANIKTRMAVRSQLKVILGRRDFLNNCQNIHTPYSLCYEQIERLEKYTPTIDKDFLVFNMEYIEVLIYDFGVAKERIWFVTDCKQKAALLGHPRYNGVNVEIVSFDKEGIKTMKPFNSKKFDVVLGNPPYETKKDEQFDKTQAIWNLFVEKSIQLCKETGFVCLIHPSGWRGEGKMFKKAGDVLKSKQIHYLEIHNETDGFKIFGATTRYDWYVLQNIFNCGKTKIKDQNGELSEIDLKDIPLIPNYDINKILSMISKDGEERVEILYSRSDYGSDKKWTNEEKNDIYKYPVIYSTPISGPTIWYSSTSENGHFGISKIILNPRRPIGFVMDEKGEYGMSQFCIGIIGDNEYLGMVSTVLKNQKTNGFADFMEACHLNDQIFNKEAIACLKKDFWKEFI